MSLDISTLQFRDIKYLLAVYRMKSFRKAAELCQVSQATISGQILKIERLFNMNLIERSSRKISFTPEALPIIEQLIKIQDELKVLSDLCFGAQDQDQTSVGEFNVGIIPTIAPFFIGQILEPLKQRFPNYRFKLTEMTTEQIVQELEFKQCDFAIVANHPIIEPWQKLSFGEDELYFLVHAKSPNCLGELATSEVLNAKVFLLADGNCLRDNVLDICSRGLPGASSLPQLGEDNYEQVALELRTNQTEKDQAITGQAITGQAKEVREVRATELKAKSPAKPCEDEQAESTYCEYAVNCTHTDCKHHARSLVDLRYGASSIDTLKAIVGNNMGVSIIPHISLQTAIPDNTRIVKITGRPTRALYTIFNQANAEICREITNEITKLYAQAYKKLKVGKFAAKAKDIKAAQALRAQVLNQPAD